MPLITLLDLEKSLALNHLLLNSSLGSHVNAQSVLSNLLDYNTSLQATQSLMAVNKLMNGLGQQQQQQQLQQQQQQQLTAAAKQTNYSRYKTELCRQFSENGECKYGEKCQFAHGMNELKDVNRHPKYKTDFCKTFHSKGFCPYGPRCHFIHEFNEKHDMTTTTTTTTSTTKLRGSSSGTIDKQLDALHTQLGTSLYLSTSSSTSSTSSSSSSSSSTNGSQSGSPEAVTATALAETGAGVSVTKDDDDLFASIVFSNGGSPKSSASSSATSPAPSLNTPVRTRSSVSSTSSNFSSNSSTISFDYMQGGHQSNNAMQLSASSLAAVEASLFGAKTTTTTPSSSTAKSLLSTAFYTADTLPSNELLSAVNSSETTSYQRIIW